MKATATWNKEIDRDGSPVIIVRSNWNAKVDRTEALGFALKPNADRLATRLVAAINAGVVFTNPEIKTDVYGKTYVSSDCAVMGRYLNADLNRLGF